MQDFLIPAVKISDPHSFPKNHHTSKGRPVVPGGHLRCTRDRFVVKYVFLTHCDVFFLQFLQLFIHAEPKITSDLFRNLAFTGLPHKCVCHREIFVCIHPFPPKLTEKISV